MKIIIVIVSAAAASIVATLIARSFSIGSSSMIGGGVGGAIGAIVALKLYSKKHKAN